MGKGNEEMSKSLEQTIRELSEASAKSFENRRTSKQTSKSLRKKVEVDVSDAQLTLVKLSKELKDSLTGGDTTHDRAAKDIMKSIEQAVKALDARKLSSTAKKLGIK